jgi:hypothetical protein
MHLKLQESEISSQKDGMIILEHRKRIKTVEGKSILTQTMQH